MRIGDIHTFRWYPGIGTNSLFISRDGGESTEPDALVVLPASEDPEEVLEFEWTVTGPAASNCIVYMYDDSDATWTTIESFGISSKSMQTATSLKIGIGI